MALLTGRTQVYTPCPVVSFANENKYKKRPLKKLRQLGEVRPGDGRPGPPSNETVPRKLRLLHSPMIDKKKQVPIL